MYSLRERGLALPYLGTPYFVDSPREGLPALRSEWCVEWNRWREGGGTGIRLLLISLFKK